jgi:hypothetical protein
MCALRAHVKLRFVCGASLRVAIFRAKLCKKYPAVGPKGPCFDEKISRCSGYFIQNKGASLQKEGSNKPPQKEDPKGTPYF